MKKIAYSSFHSQRSHAFLTLATRVSRRTPSTKTRSCSLRGLRNLFTFWVVGSAKKCSDGSATQQIWSSAGSSVFYG